MLVIFIRHGTATAAGRGGDAARQLTAAGRDEVQATAEGLGAMGVGIDCILTSPLLRATESAGIIAKAHGRAAVEAAEFLAPPGDPKACRRHLESLDPKKVRAVALVGHTPSLEECIGQVVIGARQMGLSLSKAGAACVDLPAGGADRSAELRWLLRREQLAMLARAGGDE